MKPRIPNPLIMLMAFIITLLIILAAYLPLTVAHASRTEPYTMQVQVYHYALDERCTGQWTSLNKTASGTTPKPNRTIAHGSLPFGTVVMIGGDQYVVEDRGVTGNKIDVFVGSYDEAVQLGTYKEIVTVYPLPDPNPHASWDEIAAAMSRWLGGAE